MIKLYGREFTKGELLRYVGDISQIAGLKRYELVEGNEKGVEAVEFRTGTGFNFVVLPGRGMDISFAEYKGVPLCWRSSVGDVEASFFEPEGLGWLRSFYGGLLVTCGMTYAGAPCEDEGEKLGLHGRVSNIPAKNVWADTKWEGNEFTMWVQGKVRETSVFGENLLLTRRIWARLGEAKLHVYDIVENEGFTETPHMFLYHINIGFPIVDEGAELLAPSIESTPRDDDAKAGFGRHFSFESPTPGYREQVFYHEMAADDNDHVYVALVNRKFNGGEGIGIYVRYHKSQLPRFIEWKMMGEGTYVVGLEPANCLVEGRDKERERGTLQFIEPGGRRHYETEIGVLRSNREIEEMERKIEGIRHKRQAV